MENKKFVIRCRAIIFDEGKLLVVKHPHDTSFVALPGGHLEWGENIKEVLSREIKEELGVDPEIGRLLYINNFMDGENIQSIEFFFEILNSSEYKNIENITKTHAHEITETLWVGSSDLVTLRPKELWEDFKTGKIFSDQIRYIKNH
ncbi:MAG: NUDIX domain-containing protein [Candidatus Paceibacterota bacterium]